MLVDSELSGADPGALTAKGRNLPGSRQPGGALPAGMGNGSDRDSGRPHGSWDVIVDRCPSQASKLAKGWPGT